MDHFASLFMVSPLLLGVLFFVAMLAGFIDSLAGGGSSLMALLGFTTLFWVSGGLFILSALWIAFKLK